MPDNATVTNPGDFLKEYVATWNRHDLDGVVATYAADAQRFSGIGSVRGRDAIRESIGRFLAAFPDSHVTTVNWASNGPVLLYEALDEGTHTGPLVTPSGTVQGAGRPFRIEAAGVMIFQGEAIAIERVYFDIGQLYKQLGVAVS